MINHRTTLRTNESITAPGQDYILSQTGYKPVLHMTLHYSLMLTLIPLVTALLCLLATSHLPANQGPASKAFKLVAKPALPGAEYHPRQQPTVPENYRELPFSENAQQPQLSAPEQQIGYLLFHRPITEPVYPNTRPRSHERLAGLSAFATPGEFEPVTFSIYPVRDLVNFRVAVSPLTGPNGEIERANISVRLATYWNVGYPRYTSRDTFRRLPELLERATSHSSPANECQRWWIRIHVPDATKPGLYRGTVTAWDDGFGQAIQVPLTLRVLGFKLKRDPAKHYSAYYHVRNPVQFRDKDETFIRKATENEYRTMVEYGLDMLPTFYLRTDSKNEKIVVADAEELDRMLAAGMGGPLPVAGGNALARIYQATTPGGKRGSHWKISKMPPPEFYDQVTAMFKQLEATRRAQGWPELVCCPLDEVAASSREFGARVYQAVRDAGIRTYATKNPLAADADLYRSGLDVWCSQPYSMPYDKIIAQDRYEYWCYPNHNAGEIKDRSVMCKGGRMTYGFGFWRSGYTTLIPWHWAWTPRPDQFDYLRGTHSGCGQRIGDDGDVIPAVYWECFREGRDDARYIYTLQQALFERADSTDPKCRGAVEYSRTVLEETWNAIDVQEKYLANGMWPSAEFNARRWRIATAIADLLNYSATRNGVAPSVMATGTIAKTTPIELDLIKVALRQGILKTKDLGGDFNTWSNGTKEGKTSKPPSANWDGLPTLRWTIAIDHKTDGGEGGSYPIGWPRLRRGFADGQLDMTRFDYLELMIRVDSNRDEVADDSTKLGLSIGSHQNPHRLYETRRDLGDHQREWIPVRLAIPEIMAAASVGDDPWKSISHLQLFIAESDYRHGDQLTFDIGSVKLLRFTTPLISRLDVPRFVMLPEPTLPVTFDLVGAGATRIENHSIHVQLIDRKGNVCAKCSQNLVDSTTAVLDTSRLTPGKYTLKAEILTAAGKSSSARETTVDCLAGPLFAGPLFTID